MVGKKIVIIGAGSQFTEFFLQEVFKYEIFKGTTLALVDRKPERGKLILNFVKKLSQLVGWEMNVETYTDRREALPCADYVYCFAAQDIKETWAMEFVIANKFGIHPFEAVTAGAPGLGTAIRQIPIVLDVCEDMEKLCPDAWLILENNPLAKTLSAVYKYTKIKAVGYCNGHELVQMALEQILDDSSTGSDADSIAREFMVPENTIDLLLAGINHLQWAVQIRSTSTGEDLYPKLRVNIVKQKGKIPSNYKFSAEVCRIFGYFPSCGDNHVADYLWFCDAELAKTLEVAAFPVAGWFGGRDANTWENITSKVTDLESAKKFIAGRRTGWYSPQIAGFMMNGNPKFFPNLNLMNNGAISNLSDDIIVELPGIIGSNGVKAMQVGKIPDEVAPYCQLQGSISNIAAEAAATGSKEKALQALLMDPFIHSATIAPKLLDEILLYNKKYDTRFE
jgi:alpha-galactosidase